MKKTPTAEREAYRRILETAQDLFYRQGYRATGINEIIEKSGVAKATFYANFPSKEDLALAYIQTLNQAETEAVLKYLRRYPGPYEKLLGLLEYSIGWAKETQYRGCAYLNISSEMTDHEHPVRRESKNRYRSLRSLIGGLVRELKAERGASWKDRDADKVADDFMLLLAGALAMAQIYHDPQPFKDAIAAGRRLLA